jgi:hypothetical protein
MLSAIRKWVISQMVKSDPSGVVKTLPKQDLIELNTQITANRLMTNGIDPNALQNANQVENALNQIEAMEKANLARNIRGGINETRTAKVMDMEGQEIPPGSRIMGGKEVKETEAEIADRIKRENQLAVQNIKIKKAGESKLNMFKGLDDNKKLTDDEYQDFLDEIGGEDRLEAYEFDGTVGSAKKILKQDVEYEQSMFDQYRKEKLNTQPVTSLDNQITQAYNDAIKEGKFKNVRLKDGREIKSEDDFREYIDELNEDNNFDFAEGGRAGYKMGLGPGFKKLLQSMSDNSPVQAYKKYLQSVKNRAQTDPKQLVPELGAVAAGGIFVNRRMSDILEGMKEKQKEKYLEEFKKELNNDPFYKKRPELKDKIIESYIESKFGEKKADGGRIGLFMGGPSAGPGLVRQLMRYFSGGTKSGKKGSEIMQMMNPKSYEKLLNDPAIYTKFNIKEGLGAPDMVKNMQRQASKDRLNMVKDFLGTAKRLKKADDDKLKYKSEVKERLMKDVGLSEEEAELAANRLSAIAESVVDSPRSTPKVTEEGILGLENILKNMETGGKEARQLNAVGGRIGYKLGSIDKARRAFLKLLGAGAATTAAVKSGLIGLGKKGKVAKEIIKTPPVKGKPEWFDSLVNKVILEGDDVTKKLSVQDRQVVHNLKIDDMEDVTVYRNLDDGEIRVSYDSPNNMGEQSVDLVFKPGMADETTKGKPADQFYAVEVEPRGIRMGPDDYDIEFDGENLVDNVDELMSDTTKLKSLAGKNPTMREIVEGTKKKKKVQAMNEDTVEQAEYLETKYGPGDEGDPNFQDFSDYASGGIARMLGE